MKLLHNYVNHSLAKRTNPKLNIKTFQIPKNYGIQQNRK